MKNKILQIIDWVLEALMGPDDNSFVQIQLP